MTTAVSGPTASGPANASVNDVVVADKTVAFPDESRTLLPAADGLKLFPDRTRLVAEVARLAVDATRDTKTEVATCTGAPLVPLYDETIAVSGPTASGPPVNDSVNEVGVAEVIVAVPLESCTLVPPVGSNPLPDTSSDGAFVAKLVVDAVMDTTVAVATVTGAPLVPPNDVTTAKSGPAASGPVKDSVIDVDVIAPITNVPELSWTEVEPDVSKPVPVMMRVDADVARYAVFWFMDTVTQFAT